jgi:hypothetical protein
MRRAEAIGRFSIDYLALGGENASSPRLEDNVGSPLDQAADEGSRAKHGFTVRGAGPRASERVARWHMSKQTQTLEQRISTALGNGSVSSAVLIELVRDVIPGTNDGKSHL